MCLQHNTAPLSWIFFVSSMTLLMGNNFLCHPSWFRLAVWQFCIFQTFLVLQPIAEDLWQLIHVHIHECDHWLFTMILLQVWFNNEAYKTKEGYFSFSKQINNSVTDFRAALTCQLFVFWEAFPKSHYLFYIWPYFYHPICNTLAFHPSSGTKV